MCYESPPAPDRPGADSREVLPGVVIDVDENGAIVGIDIEHASQVVDLTRLEPEPLSVTSVTVVGK